MPKFWYLHHLIKKETTFNNKSFTNRDTWEKIEILSTY